MSQFIRDVVHDPGDGNGSIIVRSTLTTSASEMTEVTYLDPEDGEFFQRSTLNAVARGHIYSYQRSGKRFLVKNEIRCFDYETAALVKNLGSFENGPDAQRLHPSAASNKRLKLAATNSFYLNDSDLKIFRIRVESMEGGPGILNSLAVDIEAYLEGLKSLRQKVKLAHEGLVNLRAAQAAVDSPEAAEKATGLLMAFAAVRDDLRASQHEVWTMSERLLVQEGQEAERMQAEELLKDTTTRCGQLLAIQTFKEAQVIEAARRLACGEKVDGLHVGSLRDEIQILKKFFPQLKYVTVDNDPEHGHVLRLSVAGVTLSFSEDKVWGEGNPATLGPIFGEGVDLDVADDEDFGYDGVSFADLG